MDFRFVYFGNDRFDAYTNSALDEVLLEKTMGSRKAYVRFYEFEKPSFILASSQHPADLANVNGYDVTRRISSGGIMLCDGSSVAYSVILPVSGDFKQIHKMIGTKIGTVIQGYIDGEVSLGEHFSIRVNDGIIAGHGQRARNRESGSATLYHGVLAVKPWDIELLNMAVKMSNEEKVLVAGLESLDKYNNSVDNQMIVRDLLIGITDGNYELISEDEKQEILMQAVGLAEKKYRNPLWLLAGPHWYDGISENEARKHSAKLKKGKGFCFTNSEIPEPKIDIIPSA